MRPRATRPEKRASFVEIEPRALGRETNERFVCLTP